MRADTCVVRRTVDGVDYLIEVRGGVAISATVCVARTCVPTLVAPAAPPVLSPPPRGLAARVLAWLAGK